MSVYSEVMIEIDKMLEGTRFNLLDQPEITNWSNGVEVKLRLREWKEQVNHPALEVSASETEAAAS